ncbi:MAG: response regulator [Deltaproteobacteria bacterium]|nr:response regulator [Deltaproteobacteria bacterium]
MSSLTILVTAANFAFRHAATEWLLSHDGIGEVCTAQSLTEASAAVQARPFDVVFVDARLPDMESVVETRQLKRGPFSPRVVLMTLDDVRFYHDVVAELGLDGVITKFRFGDEVTKFLAAPPWNMKKEPETI